MTTERDIDTTNAMARAAPRLDREELARLAAQNDDESRWRIALANVRLAMTIAHAQHRRGTFPGYPLDDMIQDAILGLYDAAEHYDPNRGSFSTCAVHWIMHRLRRSYADLWTDIRVPVHHHEQNFRNNERTALMTIHRSLSEPVGRHGDERLTIGGMLADPNNPYDAVDDADAVKSLLDHIVRRYVERRTLYVSSNDRMREYVRRLAHIIRAKLDGESMASIGRQMKVSRQWIAMIVDEMRDYTQEMRDELL